MNQIVGLPAKKAFDCWLVSGLDAKDTDGGGGGGGGGGAVNIESDSEETEKKSTICNTLYLTSRLNIHGGKNSLLFTQSFPI